ncbi:phosphomethylpyrimidine synthase ThiC [[Eubacterium] cellulosolvens]
MAYKSLFDYAQAGKITKEFKEIANMENESPEFIREKVAAGEIIIMTRKNKPSLGIGTGLTTKINANIGTSSDNINPGEEIKKAVVAEKFGADTISDLSMGGDIDSIRREILRVTRVPLTTVPIYQAIVDCGSFKNVDMDDYLRILKNQIAQGVNSVVVHAGFTKEILEALRDMDRIMGMVSKGGALTAAWIIEHGFENPLLGNFDEILELLYDNDVVLSLGNTMRSGCIYDIKDKPQLNEISLNTKLAKRANKAGIQVIVEGMGGHIQPAEIPQFVQHYKKVTGNRPLFVAGPLPTDIAVGYDHIAASVGGSMASGAGADYLCYITPAEHLGLPNIDQVREGVVAFKIAAHICDTLKFGPSERDRLIAVHRHKQDWDAQFELALDGERAREIHPVDQKICTMCGRYCALRIMEKFLKSDKV